MIFKLISVTGLLFSSQLFYRPLNTALKSHVLEDPTLLNRLKNFSISSFLCLGASGYITLNLRKFSISDHLFDKSLLESYSQEDLLEKPLEIRYFYELTPEEKVEFEAFKKENNYLDLKDLPKIKNFCKEEQLEQLPKTPKFDPIYYSAGIPEDCLDPDLTFELLVVREYMLWILQTNRITNLDRKYSLSEQHEIGLFCLFYVRKWTARTLVPVSSVHSKEHDLARKHVLGVLLDRHYNLSLLSLKDELFISICKKRKQLKQILTSGSPDSEATKRSEVLENEITDLTEKIKMNPIIKIERNLKQAIKMCKKVCWIDQVNNWLNLQDVVLLIPMGYVVALKDMQRHVGSELMGLIPEDMLLYSYDYGFRYTLIKPLDIHGYQTVCSLSTIQEKKSNKIVENLIPVVCGFVVALTTSGILTCGLYLYREHRAQTDRINQLETQLQQITQAPLSIPNLLDLHESWAHRRMLMSLLIRSRSHIINLTYLIEEFVESSTPSQVEALVSPEHLASIRLAGEEWHRIHFSF